MNTDRRRQPAVPNTTAHGQDDPAGRQKKRRVEVVFDTSRQIVNEPNL